LLIAAALSCSRARPTVEELRAMHDISARFSQRFTISREDADLYGLKITEVRGTGEVSGDVSRLLIVSPAGNQTLITWVSEPRTGRAVTRLEDDGRTWWAEWWLETGVEAEDLAQAMAVQILKTDHGSLLDDLREALQPCTRAVALRTSDGLVYSAAVDIRSRDSGAGAFVAAIKRSPEWEVLARQVPEALVEAVAFLDAAAAGTPPFTLHAPPTGGEGFVFYWSGLTTVLASSLRDAGILGPPARDGRWVVKGGRGSIVSDLGVADREDLELTAKFLSIEPTDPLPEREVTELLLAVREAPGLDEASRQPPEP
jgi:hypothetical protein